MKLWWTPARPMELIVVFTPALHSGHLFSDLPPILTEAVSY
jgi:hypothetical protein